MTVCTPFAIRHRPAALSKRAYAGPQFGIDGTRELAGVRDRPLLGTIIKPSVGLDAEQIAALVKTLEGARALRWRSRRGQPRTESPED
jgi:hypothetical protein